MQDISVLYLAQTDMPPGSGCYTHTHDYWHFSLVLRGKYDKGGKVPRCTWWAPGTLCDERVALEPSQVINVMFLVHDKSLYRSLEAFPYHALQEEELHIPLILNILEQVRTLSPSQHFVDFAFGYYLHLLLETPRLKQARCSEPADLVSRALSFIQENYMDQIRLEDVARHIDRTPQHTSYLVKEATGSTVVEHIREVRLDQACKLLAYSKIPLEQIISQCGFISSSYFHRIFKEKTGMPPGKYRTSHPARDAFYRGDEETLDIPYEAPVFTYIPGARKCIHWSTPREYISQQIK